MKSGFAALQGLRGVVKSMEGRPVFGAGWLLGGGLGIIVSCFNTRFSVLCICVKPG